MYLLIFLPLVDVDFNYAKIIRNTIFAARKIIFNEDFI